MTSYTIDRLHPWIILRCTLHRAPSNVYHPVQCWPPEASIAGVSNSLKIGMQAMGIQLHLRPLLKAAATSSVMMAAGDVVCQSLQQRNQPQTRIDWRRAGRFALVGATLHGPFFFTGMQLLDSRFGRAQTLRTAMVKSAVGQVTLFPTYISLFFMYMGTLDGLGLQVAAAKLAGAFPAAAATGTLFWPAANLITFTLDPSRRVAFLGVAGIAWNSLLSYLNSRPLTQQQEQQQDVKELK